MARDRLTRPVPLVELFAKSARLAPRGVAWQTWRDIVGSHVARRSRPNGLSGSTLFVTVSSSSWAQELSLLGPRILERLAKAGHPITALRFQVGEVKLPPRAPEPRQVSRRSLPPELQARLSTLDDPRLRELIAEAAGYTRE
jgi:predicted nucleic acid-binding Zn ribbon protein